MPNQLVVQCQALALKTYLQATLYRLRMMYSQIYVYPYIHIYMCVYMHAYIYTNIYLHAVTIVEKDAMNLKEYGESFMRWGQLFKWEKC